MDESGISDSISMLSTAHCARYWAYRRLKTTDSLLKWLVSLAHGIRAKMADIAKLTGVEGWYSSWNVSVSFWKCGTAWSMGRPLGGGRIGKNG